MAKKCEIDRLSALPDTILACNIFSRLSLRYVIRTSLLSSRWRSQWKQTTHLDFSQEFLKSLKLSSQTGRSSPNKIKQDLKYMNSIIDNILLLHSGHLEGFSLHVKYSENWWDTDKYPVGKLHVEQWVHYAALKQVKHMSLRIQRNVPSSLFACHGLRNLELHNFIFTGIPTGFGGFRSLQSCSLSNLRALTDDGLKQLIGLCPLLQKLVVAKCLDLINLKIEAPNLNYLKILLCSGMESLTADCPQLVELEIDNTYYTVFEFKVISCVLFRDLHTSDVPIPEELQKLNSLRKLSLKACPSVLASTLVSACFRNLEEVHIQICDIDHWGHNPAKGKLVLADSTFPRLKKAHVDISSTMKKDEAIMLAFLLKNAPSLNTITVIVPYCPSNIHGKKFKKKVLHLQQIYKEVDIRMKIDEKRLDQTCKFYVWGSDDFDDDYEYGYLHSMF